MLAHAVAAGERIVGVQHGGVYGTAALAAYAPDLEYCYDRFVTWGWTSHATYDGRFLPLPSPMLSGFAKRRRPAGRDLILVGTVMPRLNPRLDYSANPLDYRRWKLRFVSGLTSAVRADLRYRPDQSDYSIADADWLRRYFGDLSIVQGDLQQAMSSCRLVILDHPGTALAEALAANIPTVCFWNKEQWLLSPTAQLLFDQLRHTRILFDQPEAAATQINAVFPNIESWWQMPERQRARAEWCRSFARVDRHWLAQWLRAFATL
jgi:putative transferase (TIGR04331 family)